MTISSSDIQPRQRTTASDARFAFTVLLLVALFNHIDRTIVSILQEPIKRDLNLSDSQLGILTGLSFALFYGFLAIPVSRVADRVHRKTFMALALAIWSAMTALCGLATSYLMLIVCRMGVALGESSCSPATLSLFSDYYPIKQRGTPIAIWAMAVPVGTSFGLVGGGWISAEVGWRNAFLVAGILGLLLTPFLLLMKEPPRGQHDGYEEAAAPAVQPSLSQAVAILWRLRTFRHFLIAGTVLAFFSCALQYWAAPFYMRTFHLPIGEVALFLVVLNGIGGAIGAFAGGFATDLLARKNVRWYGLLPTLTTLAVAPFALAQFLVENPFVSLAFGFFCAVFLNMFLAPLNTVTQSLVRSEMRAFTSATTLVFVNIGGLGFGPFAAGVISDALVAHGYSDSLRYALTACMVLALPSAWFFYRSSLSISAELPDRSE